METVYSLASVASRLNITVEEVLILSQSGRIQIHTRAREHDRLGIYAERGQSEVVDFTYTIYETMVVEEPVVRYSPGDIFNMTGLILLSQENLLDLQTHGETFVRDFEHPTYGKCYVESEGRGLRVTRRMCVVTSEELERYEQGAPAVVPTTSDAPQERCSVELRGPDEGPLVFGREMPPLTTREYAIIKAMCSLFPKRRVFTSIAKKAGCPGAQANILTNLRKSNSEWARAISMAETPGKGYALASSDRETDI